jgi:phosphatidylglycerol lysyltransferase
MAPFMKPVRKIFLALVLGALIAGCLLPASAETPQPDRTEVVLKLKRGNFTVYRYVPGDAPFAAHPRAVIIFGSGDGGFDGWEDRVCHALQTTGYEMLGFDCAHYSQTDYDLDILQADMNAIAQSSLAHYGNQPPPLILGGWSMGAEQAVAAAGGPHPPAGLVGLLLISPGDRGRYGLRFPDRCDVSPTGPGTFALLDFAHNLDKTRVAQWNGNLDLMGSKTWLDSLTAPHKAYGFPWGLHDYNGASDDFLKQLEESITWVLLPNPSTSKAPEVQMVPPQPPMPPAL